MMWLESSCFCLQLVELLECELKCPDLADLKIRCIDGRTVQAHRLVLAASSPSLRQNFKNEPLNKDLEIGDFTSDVLDLVLQALYVGGVFVDDAVQLKACQGLARRLGLIGLNVKKQIDFDEHTVPLQHWSGESSVPPVNSTPNIRVRSDFLFTSHVVSLASNVPDTGAPDRPTWYIKPSTIAEGDLSTNSQPSVSAELPGSVPKISLMNDGLAQVVGDHSACVADLPSYVKPAVPEVNCSANSHTSSSAESPGSASAPEKSPMNDGLAQVAGDHSACVADLPSFVKPAVPEVNCSANSHTSSSAESPGSASAPEKSSMNDGLAQVAGDLSACVSDLPSYVKPAVPEVNCSANSQIISSAESPGSASALKRRGTEDTTVPATELGAASDSKRPCPEGPSNCDAFSDQDVVMILEVPARSRQNTRTKKSPVLIDLVNSTGPIKQPVVKLPCKPCKKIFLSDYDYKKHMFLNHDAKSLECPVCVGHHSCSKSGYKRHVLSESHKLAALLTARIQNHIEKPPCDSNPSYSELQSIVLSAVPKSSTSSTQGEAPLNVMCAAATSMSLNNDAAACQTDRQPGVVGQIENGVSRQLTLANGKSSQCLQTTSQNSKKSDLKCHFCPRWMNDKRLFVAHMLVKHNFKTISCAICHMIFDDRELWKTHIKMQHLKQYYASLNTIMESSEVKTKCSVCRQLVPSKGLNLHYSMVHNFLNCPYCLQVMAAEHLVPHFADKHKKKYAKL